MYTYGFEGSRTLGTTSRWFLLSSLSCRVWYQGLRCKPHRVKLLTSVPFFRGRSIPTSTSGPSDSLRRKTEGREEGASPTDHEIQEFSRAAVLGLSDAPRWLPCRFLYDERGSALFEQITEQPEYYPARTVAGFLERHAAEIVERT